jgi:hypothetical protein
MMMYILVIFLMVLSAVQPKYYLVETAEGAKPNFAGEAGKDYGLFCQSSSLGYPGISCVDRKIIYRHT